MASKMIWEKIGRKGKKFSRSTRGLVNKSGLSSGISLQEQCLWKIKLGGAGVTSHFISLSLIKT